MYAYVYIYIYTCVYIYIYTYIHPYITTHIYIYIYISLSLSLSLSFYLSLSLYIYIYIYIHVYIRRQRPPFRREAAAAVSGSSQCVPPDAGGSAATATRHTMPASRKYPRCLGVFWIHQWSNQEETTCSEELHRECFFEVSSTLRFLDSGRARPPRRGSSSWPSGPRARRRRASGRSSGISRIRFIHSSNQVPCSSNSLLFCV